MQEGMEIDGMRSASGGQKKRGPKPGFKRNSPRPPVESEILGAKEVRPDVMRGSNSVREAEEYANRVLAGLSGAFDNADEFHVDPATWPDGWTYEWKAVEIAGKQNLYHMTQQKKNGWRPVPAERHPEIMPDGASGPIIKKGLMLMELPTVLVDKFQSILRRDAKDQLANAEAQLYETPAHTAPREEFPEKMRFVKKEVMREVSGSEK